MKILVDKNNKVDEGLKIDVSFKVNKNFKIDENFKVDKSSCNCTFNNRKKKPSKPMMYPWTKHTKHI